MKKMKKKEQRMIMGYSLPCIDKKPLLFHISY
jgi:hypothetical protein